jgi:regulator of sigma E protease
VSYVLAVLGFVALIILHEGGHFVAAKAVGMRVERFALFFPPLLARRTWGGTEYAIGAIPLGGYVKITGMNPQEEIPPEAEAGAYYNQPVWKRIVVIAAGPIVNIVIAFVIVWGLFLSQGQYSPSDRVAAVLHPSAAAGVLRPGDQIVSIDGISGNSTVLRNEIAKDRCAGPEVNGCKAATPLVTVIRRGHRLLTLVVRPRYTAADKRMLVGFDFGVKNVPTGAANAASLSVTWLWGITKQTVSTFAQLFKPKERSKLQGVVGVYVVTQKAINASPSLGLEILALISLSLGIINLFPFLPLDGGHIFWALAEKVRGRSVSLVTMERASFVGFALVAMLFVIGLSNSISTLAGKGFSVP